MIPHFETSAKDAIDVESAFLEAATQALRFLCDFFSFYCISIILITSTFFCH